MKKYFLLALFFFTGIVFVESQQKDSVHTIPVFNEKIDTVVSSPVGQLEKILKNNRSIHFQSTPVSSFHQKRIVESKDGLFYQLVSLLFFLGILKIAFSKYFVNMVRVFFNTSLRQSQLTDQLLISKQPSLFFNIYFVIVGGYYFYFLLVWYGKAMYNLNLLLLCFGAILFVYSTKYLVLKFTGWLTGFKKEANDYIFIVFLVNKILGLLLLPFIVIIPFAEKNIVQIVLIVSYFLIIALLLFRYIRSYEILQYRLKASRRHFFLYIFGIELLPLLLIYKLVMIFINKSL